MRWWLVLASGWMIADCSRPPPAVHATVPARPADGAAADLSKVETFAIDSIFLGDVDRNGQGYEPGDGGLGSCNGTPSRSAPGIWQSFGYDLDDKITNKDSTDVCTLHVGALRENQRDGVDGIDNAWGAIAMSAATGATSGPISPSAFETQQIQAGAWTLQLQVRGLPDTATPVVGIAAQVFTSGAFDGGAPAFDATTDWPVVASSTMDGATVAGGARVTSTDAYVTDDGMFVSGTPSSSPIVLRLAVATNLSIVLHVHQAVVTFLRSGPSRLVQGTIAGVLETEESISLLQPVAGAVSASLCGSAFDGIADQIRQASDILHDGTNAPSVPCDAISIGLGFTARKVAEPTKVVADPSQQDPCTLTLDAGLDAPDDAVAVQDGGAE